MSVTRKVTVPREVLESSISASLQWTRVVANLRVPQQARWRTVLEFGIGMGSFLRVVGALLRSRVATPLDGRIVANAAVLGASLSSFFGGKDRKCS